MTKNNIQQFLDFVDSLEFNEKKARFGMRLPFRNSGASMIMILTLTPSLVLDLGHRNN